MHFPAWLARAGRLLEGPVARLVYRRHGCVAVSPSTVAAMRDRLRWTGDIYVIPNGAPAPGAAAAAAPAGSTVSWVGRLVAHKRPGLILPWRSGCAAAGSPSTWWAAGPAPPSLAGQSARPRLAGTVRLRGFLPEAEKQALVGRIAAAPEHLTG